MSNSSVRAVVVIPAFNEEQTVGNVVRGVVESGLPVVVVSDGSTDATAQQAQRAGATVVVLPANLGIGGALRCGFRWAVENGYDAAIQVDADGQHDPGQIRQLLDAALQADAHLLVGSRFSGAGGYESTRSRRAVMRLLSRVATKAAGTPISDSTSGFRVIRGPLLVEFARSYPMYFGDSFEVLVQAARHGYRVRETPAIMREREVGESTAGTLGALRFLVRAFLVLVIGSRHRYRQPDMVRMPQHQLGAQV